MLLPSILAPYLATITADLLLRPAGGGPCRTGAGDVADVLADLSNPVNQLTHLTSPALERSG